jgi:hypothetical protein
LTGTYELVHETIQQADDKMDDDGTTTITGEGKVDEVEKQTLRDENGQEIEMGECPTQKKWTLKV